MNIRLMSASQHVRFGSRLCENSAQGGPDTHLMGIEHLTHCVSGGNGPLPRCKSVHKRARTSRDAVVREHGLHLA